MASTKIATKTKVTERFTLTGEDGEVFQVEQHTRYEIKNVDGVKKEILGSAYLLTADGRGVLHGEIYNSYSIPSLGIKTLKKSSTA